MKICFVSISAYPVVNDACEGTFGGAEVQLTLLARAFARSGDHEISMVTADYGQPAKEERDGITVYRSFPLCDSHSSFLTKVRNALKLFWVLMRVPADLFVQRNAGIETGITAGVALLRKKKCVYMTSHDIDCNGDYVRHNGLRGRMYRYGLMQAHLVITQSRYHQTLLRETYKRESLVRKTGYPVSDRLPENRRTYVLWVGRIVDWKRPELYLALAEKMPDVDFVMVGPKSCSDDEYAAFCVRVEACSNMQFYAGVAFSEIDPFFQRAICFVNTSRYEGFPNTFVQSAKNGVPILSFGVNPDNVLAEEGIGSVVETVDEAVAWIGAITADRNVFNEYSRRCVSYARKEHDIEMIAAQLQNDFAGLL